jgi:hypothetical protein
MSIKDKISNAKPTTWVSDGIPKWKVRWIIWFTKLKCKINKMIK